MHGYRSNENCHLGMSDSSMWTRKTRPLMIYRKNFSWSVTLLRTSPQPHDPQQSKGYLGR
ncbi:hypothetical protein E2C01_022908 [Portunus trituberculatus]|uniref:Uncharacterized protein n=1 Tax=Portunus trituberculatus TaxID=210409 RepID=A0A5B7E9S1_PORTR|nr:hypothetical protein [Portunus trituberculatus]